ncbi:MAG: hypothetical protein HYZ22_01595 [Chloroflexi bacterium]|nr:hypothetical protein [Chloroflexota bacterium]
MIGDYAKAIEDSNSITQLMPNEDFAYGTLAIAFVYLKNYPEAIKNADIAIRINPNVGGYHFARSEANFAMGKFHEALTDVNRSIELDPKYAPAYQVRTNIYKALNT